MDKNSLKILCIVEDGASGAQVVILNKQSSKNCSKHDNIDDFLQKKMSMKTNENENKFQVQNI